MGDLLLNKLYIYNINKVNSLNSPLMIDLNLVIKYFWFRVVLQNINGASSKKQNMLPF